MAAVAVAAAATVTLIAQRQASSHFAPGERVWLDAHNCYPDGEKWADRIDRALATGLPIAIEQDLVWWTDPATGTARSDLTTGVSAMARLAKA